MLNGISYFSIIYISKYFLLFELAIQFNSIVYLSITLIYIIHTIVNIKQYELYQPILYRITRDYPTLYILVKQMKTISKSEALPGGLGIQGEGFDLFIFRDLERMVIYFQGFGEKA